MFYISSKNNLEDVNGPPAGSVVKNLPAVQEMWIQSWIGKITCRRKWQPTPVFLPGKSHGQGGLGATVHGVAKMSVMT